eukprot:CAMPEP_0117423710 /NCGR_PEP_ID=MMETSP0758-20121206/4272_1 /TAXON_ID=63605 /ORGANISM="Percolomonas cosmopolitus, Strain AE-1 (ATCC 50343)" /LENGTH=317 /DNA_ID=CAMNT_0005207047 /DNA_START=818 /DNA_END=1767 /DNA_ORIENTATION=+
MNKLNMDDDEEEEEEDEASNLIHNDEQNYQTVDEVDPEANLKEQPMLGEKGVVHYEEDLEKEVSIQTQQEEILTTEINLIPEKEKKRGKQSETWLAFLTSKVFLRSVFKLMRICIVQFLSWFGWFAYLMFITDWMGKSIFEGNPDDPNLQALYDEGVRWGSFGLAGQAVVSFISAPFIPLATRCISEKYILMMGQIVLAIVLALPFGLSYLPNMLYRKILAIGVISLFGIPWSVTMTIPFVLTAGVSAQRTKGIFLGSLNIFVTIPQLMCALVSSIFFKFISDDTSILLLCGSVSVFISIFLCLLLPTIPKEKKGGP